MVRKDGNDFSHSSSTPVNIHPNTEVLKEELCKLEKSRTSMIQDHHGNILMKDNEIKE